MTLQSLGGESCRNSAEHCHLLLPEHRSHLSFLPISVGAKGLLFLEALIGLTLTSFDDRFTRPLLGTAESSGNKAMRRAGRVKGAVSGKTKNGKRDR